MGHFNTSLAQVKLGIHLNCLFFSPSSPPFRTASVVGDVHFQVMRKRSQEDVKNSIRAQATPRPLNNFAHLKAQLKCACLIIIQCQITLRIKEKNKRTNLLFCAQSDADNVFD